MWFRGKDYSNGSVTNKHDVLADALSVYQITRPEFNDRVYLSLTTENLKSFVYKYHDTHAVAYGSNSGDAFPDCDDFSILCFADILKGSIKEGLAQQPSFGTATVRTLKGGMHMMNFGYTADGAFLLYEPQTKTWLPPTSVLSIEGLHL